jgi:hypothetical protein
VIGRGAETEHATTSELGAVEAIESMAVRHVGLFHEVRGNNVDNARKCGYKNRENRVTVGLCVARSCAGARRRPAAEA